MRRSGVHYSLAEISEQAVDAVLAVLVVSLLVRPFLTCTLPVGEEGAIAQSMGSDGLENASGAHAGANAHRHHAVLLSATVQAVQQGRHADGPGSA